jgi:hypothetical protein
MSTWSDVFDTSPDLADAARELARRWAAPLGRAGVEPFDPDEEVRSSALLALIAFAEMRKVERHYVEATQAERSWAVIGTAVADNQPVRYFKNRAGDLVELPESFVAAFTGGKRLDCVLREDEDDPSWVEVVRGGKVQTSLPKTLLDYLVEARDRASGTSPASHVPSRR